MPHVGVEEGYQTVNTTHGRLQRWNIGEAEGRMLKNAGRRNLGAVCTFQASAFLSTTPLGNARYVNEGNIGRKLQGN